MLERKTPEQEKTHPIARPHTFSLQRLFVGSGIQADAEEVADVTQLLLVVEPRLLIGGVFKDAHVFG